MTHSSTDMLLGINALNHDASIALVHGTEVKFAAHSERYSRIKNDRLLNKGIVEDMLQYGTPSRILCAGNPFVEASRRLYSGERPVWSNIKQHLRDVGLGDIPVTYTAHHESHAAMGYYTSGFDRAAVVVMDAVGEWNCTSIWLGEGDRLTRQLTVNYPDSFGLFYSAMTKAIGLKPNEEEYILMGMAALGKPIHVQELLEDLFDDFSPPYLSLKDNLHRGVGDYIKDKEWDDADVAASTQAIAEQYIVGCANYVKKEYRIRNLVLVGGVALNCVANGKIRDRGWFDGIWVPPNPGDAGLSLGAVLPLTKTQINFNTAFLGYDIKRTLSTAAVVDALLSEKIIAVANGRAEFGPRALGNRSILADPRGPTIKDSVNAIKRREEFRPFAPVILEEHAKDYFANIGHNQRYMQWTNDCVFPDQFPAICHFDGSSRVQTVPKDFSTIRFILEEWYNRTGCPMLLNTSLNIKGEPLVNTWADAERFSQLHSVKVF
jgi:carbamoyltransferase